MMILHDANRFTAKKNVIYPNLYSFPGRDVRLVKKSLRVLIICTKS